MTDSFMELWQAYCDQKEEISGLTEQRDRYAAALRQVASCISFYPGDIVDIARTALAVTEER